MIIKKEISEKDIIRSIFLLPLISLSLFSFLMFIFLSFYFKEFSQEEIQNYKEMLITSKKELAKNMVEISIQDINHKIEDLNINIKNKLINRIDEATAIIDRIIKNNKEKSKTQIKQLIKEVLSSIRFNNGRGYYFAYNKTSKISLIHPIKKFRNKDMSDFKDKRGVYLTKEFDKIIDKNGAGFSTIYFAKPNQPNKEFKKIIYVKYLP